MPSHPRQLAVMIYILATLTGAWLCRAANPATPNSSSGSLHLQRMLTHNITLELKKVTLSHAFSTLADTARIPIDVQQRAYRLLPLGQNTRISIQFSDVSVHQALTILTREVALHMSIADGRIVIMPSTELKRIGRRATWSELKILQTLHHATARDINRHWPLSLPAQLHQPGLIIQTPMFTPVMVKAALAALKMQLPTTQARALNIYVHALGMIWFVHNHHILIMPLQDWIYRQLQRPVFIHASDTPLQNVLAVLSHAAGVRFAPAPGLYLAVPTVNVDSNGGSVVKTLDALSGATGISWHVRRDHILLERPKSLTGTTPPSPDPIVGMIRIPLSGSAMHLNLFLRESQLPPTLRQRLAARLQRNIHWLTGHLVPAHPAATTASTRP